MKAAAIRLALKYWLIAVYVFLFSINALCTAILASLQSVEWPNLDQTTKFCIVIAVLANWTGVLLAFFNKHWSQVSEGNPPALPNPISPSTSETKPNP